MKKLLIIAVLMITANLSAQVSTPDFETKHIITGDIEVDGHKTKEKFIFKSTLTDIKITDDKGNEYQKRKCDTEKCKVIHLERKSYGTSIISGWNGGKTTLEYNLPYVK